MSTAWIDATLIALRRENLLRSLRTLTGATGSHVTLDGRRLLNFASNNYLDLAHHPRVIEAVRAAVSEWGWGAGASQLVSGNTAAHDALCHALATHKNTQDAVLFPTGYQANLGTISAFVGAGDRIILDRLAHASIIDGAKLSGASVLAFPHNNLNRLAEMLAEPCAGRSLIATERVFSMDGDRAPWAEIFSLAQQANSFLLLDEAHATGTVLDAEDEAKVLASDTPGLLRLGTLSKALGGIGGFVAGSVATCDLLRNQARAGMFTTALPPAAAAGALAALQVLDDEPQRLDTLAARSRFLRERLQAGGCEVASGDSPIIPLMTGTAEAALTLAERLLAAGILAPAIRPPTVPRGKSRLRVSVMCSHTEDDLAQVAQVITNFPVQT